MGTSIDLPKHCCPAGALSTGGNPHCEHDYPESSRVDHLCAGFSEWTCRRCGMRTRYQHWD